MSKSALPEAGVDTAAARQLIEIADQFTAAGFDVRSPAWETTSYLRLTNVPGARCELSIARNGTVVWDYHLGTPSLDNYPYIASIILSLLRWEYRRPLDDTNLPNITQNIINALTIT